MKLRGEVILIILLIFYIPWVTNQLLSALIDIGEIGSWVLKISGLLKTGTIEPVESRITRTCSASKPFKNVVFTRFSGAVSELSREFGHLKENINTRLENIVGLIEELEKDIDIDYRISHLREKMILIDDRYNVFEKKVAIKTSTFAEGNLCLFASTILQSSSLSTVVDEMHNIVVSSSSLHQTLLTLIVDAFKKQEIFTCDDGHSLFDSLHSFYNGLLIAEIKAFILEAFAHNFLFSYNGAGISCKYPGTSAEIAVKEVHDKLLKHLRAYNLAFTSAMRKAPRDFRACDRGEKFMRDVTFLELEGVFQTVFYPKPPTNSCESMDTLLRLPNWNCNSHTKFCLNSKDRPCSGRLWQCKSLNLTQACIDKKGPRRYHWISSSVDDERYSKCENNSRMDITSTDSCLCHCMENTVHSTSTHLISLQPVESDVAKNMVITGIRFVVKHRILQFQIQQGELGINWRVKNVSWKPVNDISEQIRAVRLKREIRGSPEVKENEDFLIIKIGENNAINFDELHVSPNHVLTGVRFMISGEVNATLKRIEISLIATKFNYTTGKLCIECEKEIIRSKIVHEREYLISGNPIIPQFPTIPDSDPAQFIKIQTSNWSIDGGQTTLPLFDAVSLVTDPPSPVGGLGLFYKKAGNFTGLVSLKFISVDYIDLMIHSESRLDSLLNITAEEIHLPNFDDGPLVLSSRVEIPVGLKSRWGQIEPDYGSDSDQECNGYGPNGVF